MDVHEAVRNIVMGIPYGCVSSYGEIGCAVGIGARQAGRVVSSLGDDVPWWRVVYADGTPATCHGGTALALLVAEDVPFLRDRIDMASTPAARSPND